MKNKQIINQKTNIRGLAYVIKRTIRTHITLTIVLIIVLIGSIIFTLIPPLILENIVNELINNKKVEIWLAIFYFGTLILIGIFDSSKEMMITMFGQKITHGLRSEMCKKLKYLPTSYYTQNDAGMITSRFVNDVDTVESLFANGIISMIVDACKVISIIVVIFTKSIGLGTLLVFVAPILLILTRIFQKKMLRAQKKNRVAVGNVNNYIPETINNIRTIHNLMKETYMEKRYDERIQESYRAVEKTNLYDSIYSPIIVLISTLVIATIMILSAMGGEVQSYFGMSVGTAVAVIAYVNKVFGPIESIGMEIQNIQSAVAGVNRIDEFLSETEQGKTDRTITLEKLNKSTDKGISFEKVSFAYEDGIKVLDYLDFKVKKGEMVTLVGRTGVGKSTIFKLLLGLYQPQNGHVMIYGKDAAIIPNEEKRHLFGYVEQVFHEVPGSIAQQISLYDESISMEDIIEAAKLVGIDKIINKLPDGYDTRCDKAAFSQGQIQLLSIARAVVTNPDILLLDEITANLDSITEHEVIEALERATKGRTVISISHRLYENMGSRLITI